MGSTFNCIAPYNCYSFILQENESEFPIAVAVRIKLFLVLRKAAVISGAHSQLLRAY